jgi:hypothetical protein
MSVFRLSSRISRDPTWTEMLFVAWVNDHPDLLSFQKVWKLNVGVDMMIRWLDLRKSLMMAC